MSGFIYAGSRYACPVCGARKECRTSPDHMHFCHTNQGGHADVPGYVYMGECQQGAFGMWMHEDDLGKDRPHRDYTPGRAAVGLDPPRVGLRQPGKLP
jgi:hypothetical protein